MLPVIMARGARQQAGGLEHENLRKAVKHKVPKASANPETFKPSFSLYGPSGVGVSPPEEAEHMENSPEEGELSASAKQTMQRRRSPWRRAIIGVSPPAQRPPLRAVAIGLIEALSP